MSRKIRFFVMVLTVAAFMTSTARAGTPLRSQRGGVAAAETGFLALTWEWLLALFSPTPTAASMSSGDEGSQMDPDGLQ
jgi:hypothetical protein